MIYIVEDDAGIRELVAYTLENTGFQARGFSSAQEFWPVFQDAPPRLVLLDIMLPGEDGLSVLKRLRRLSPDLPVMMLTAKGTEYDKVKGLDMGADDYLPKPFGMMEMVARVRSLLRRTEKTKDAGELHISGIALSPQRHSVFCGGEEVSLTRKEFELLHLLMKNPGIVLTRDRLLTAVWGYDFDGETRTLDVHIRTLRGKLGKYGDRIVTVRGVGYKMEEEA